MTNRQRNDQGADEDEQERINRLVEQRMEEILQVQHRELLRAAAKNSEAICKSQIEYNKSKVKDSIEEEIEEAKELKMSSVKRYACQCKDWCLFFRQKNNEEIFKNIAFLILFERLGGSVTGTYRDSLWVVFRSPVRWDGRFCLSLGSVTFTLGLFGCIA